MDVHIYCTSYLSTEGIVYPMSSSSWGLALLAIFPVFLLLLAPEKLDMLAFMSFGAGMSVQKLIFRDVESYLLLSHFFCISGNNAVAFS